MAFLRKKHPSKIPKIIFRRSQIKRKSISLIECKVKRLKCRPNPHRTKNMEIRRIAANPWTRLSTVEWDPKRSQHRLEFTVIIALIISNLLKI